MTERPPDEAGEPIASDDTDDEGLLDRLRGGGVGTEDPNIVGDVGPTDIPPGHDPDGGLFATDAEANAAEEAEDDPGG